MTMVAEIEMGLSLSYRHHLKSALYSLPQLLFKVICSEPFLLEVLNHNLLRNLIFSHLFINSRLVNTLLDVTNKFKKLINVKNSRGPSTDPWITL